MKKLKHRNRPNQKQSRVKKAQTKLLSDNRRTVSQHPGFSRPYGNPDLGLSMGLGSAMAMAAAMSVSGARFSRELEADYRRIPDDE